MKTLSAAAMLVLLLTPGARAQTGVPPGARLDPKKFALMAWGDSPADSAQLERMKEAGLNVSGLCKVKNLDQVRAAGLSCFVIDPRADGYRWLVKPDECKLRKRARSLARAIKRKPEVIGFFLYDEPSARQMPVLGEVAASLVRAMPGRWPYINLLPMGADADDLGTKSYADYLASYLSGVHPRFVSYDNYALEHGVLGDEFYENLQTIRSFALSAHIPFWCVVLADAHHGFMRPTEATLSLQVYSALAYGARGIEYFPYFAPATGNFRDAPVDPFGHRTPTWALLREVNEQVQTLAPTLVKLESIGVYFSGSRPSGAPPMSTSTLVQSFDARTTAIGSPPASALMGEFSARRKKRYLLLVNRDIENSLRFSIQLRPPYRRLIRISPFTGKQEPFSREMEWLAPGAGILFRVK